MSFLVEDGTGLAGANSYLGEAAADDYHLDRGNAGWAGTAAARRAGLIKATMYVDGHYRFKGTKASTAQALEWPRDGATDRSGHALAGVPGRLADAVAELALIALTADLTPVLSHGGRIKAKKIGPIETEYFEDARATQVFQAIDGLLAQLITGVYDPRRPAGRLAPSPDKAAGDAALFSAGMTDHP